MAINIYGLRRVRRATARRPETPSAAVSRVRMSGRLQRLQRETSDVRVVGAARPRALEEHFERAHPHQIRLHLWRGEREEREV